MIYAKPADECWGLDGYRQGPKQRLELDQPIYTVLWFQGDRIARMQSFLEESRSGSVRGERGGVSEGDS